MLRFFLAIFVILAFSDTWASETYSEPSMASLEQTSEPSNEPAPRTQTNNNEEETSEKEKDTYKMYLAPDHDRHSVNKAFFSIDEFGNYKPPFLTGSRRPPKV